MVNYNSSVTNTNIIFSKGYRLNLDDYASREFHGSTQYYVWGFGWLSYKGIIDNNIPCVEHQRRSYYNRLAMA